MTTNLIILSVLIILALLILIAVLFLIFHVSDLSKAHRELMGNYHTAVINSMLDMQKTITKQVNTITTVVGSQQEEVVRLANKVDEGLTHCGNQTRDLKEKINNLETRIVAPIDKINDTHNRIKTLSKSAASAEDLRAVLTEVVSVIVENAVDTLSRKNPTKPKTTKKVTKEPVAEVKA